MQLLEGVVAYHSGQFDQSRKALTSAQAKFLQVIINIILHGLKHEDRRLVKPHILCSAGFFCYLVITIFANLFYIFLSLG